jgi:hypothetical protein
MKPRPVTMRGRPRDAVVTVAWAILTLGLWGAWYMFIAFREVDHQNGRRHSPLWFLGFVPLLGIAFGLLYLRRELRLLHADLRGLGGVPRASFRAVALWATLGALLLVGPAVALAKVIGDVNAYWRIVYQRHGLPWPLETLA